MEYIPFDINKFKSPSAKTLYRSLSVPSSANAYAQCIQFARDWFLSKFQDKEVFKSVYTEGRYVLEDQRSLSETAKIVKDKPALAIVPGIDLSFNNDNVDMYQYGVEMYQPINLFKDSFFKDRERQIYMGIAMETLLMPFTYKIKVETRSQQLDLYKYIQLAHRVGNTCGEEVDLDFHIPYALMIQIAMDLGYEIEFFDNKDYPKIKNLTHFLSYLNTHSSLPFVYKYRGLNGKNEFFLRMQRMYVHIKSSEISNDDGDRVGHLMSNFNIELQIEIRFPAPKFYAYYSNNEHKLSTIYTAFRQPQGLVTGFYTFKGVPIPDVNKRGWQKYVETTYEDDSEEFKKSPLVIDFKDLLMHDDLYETIKHCTLQGISPNIFMDILIINGGEEVIGSMDWDSLVYSSTHVPKSQGSYIGIYLDMEYINQYIILDRHGTSNRIQKSERPDTREEQTKQ